jgi:hypothetical protein
MSQENISLLGSCHVDRMILQGSEAFHFLPMGSTILHRKSPARIGLEMDMILHSGGLLGKEASEDSIAADCHLCCFGLREIDLLEITQTQTNATYNKTPKGNLYPPTNWSFE